MTTRDAIMDELARRFQPLLEKLGYLRDRWQDEREYEDWSDYVEAMKKLTPPEMAFVKATKAPFGFVVKGANGGFQFTASANKAGFSILT